MVKRQEIQSPEREEVAVLSAGLACNFLNVSVYPKHECAVVELISHGRIEKGELVHNGGRAHAIIIQWEVRMCALSISVLIASPL